LGSRSSRSRISAGASSFARGRQLECERQSVEPAADASDLRRAGRVEFEARIDRASSRGEQPQRIGLDERLERQGRIGRVERRHGVFALCRQPQRRAARGQDPEAWCGGEQLADERSRGQKLLEVVEDEQDAPLSQVLDHTLREGACAFPDLDRLGDGRDEQVGARNRREADEHRSVPELGLERVRDREAQSRLAGATRAGERDESCALDAEQRIDRSELQSAAHERRGRHRKRLRRAGRRRGGREARLLPEDRPLQLLQGRAGVEAELLGQNKTGVPVDLERLRLAAAAVEREQPLLEEPLAVRMLGRERFELGDDGVVSAAGEVRVVTELERSQAQLLEPLGLGGAARLLGQVGERRAAPDRERFPQVVRCVVGAARFESRSPALECALEPVEVELVLTDDHAVPAPGGLDPLTAERAAQPVHVDLQRLDGGRRRCLSPEPVDELLGRHHAPAIREQQREQPALLRRAERCWFVVVQ